MAHKGNFVRLHIFFISLLFCLYCSTYREAAFALECDNANALPSTLWPPNHKLNDINVTGISGGADVQILCIQQDEPLDAQGDGSTEYDGAGIGASAASV